MSCARPTSSRAQRGYYGGYQLARPAVDIHLDELLNAVGTRDPFSSLMNGADLPVPFIDDLRNQLQTLAAEAIHRASLADLVAHADADSSSVLKYDLTGQD